MKKINFNSKEYNCPEKWDEVTLGMVMKASEYDEILPDAPLISIIAAYTGIDINELKLSKVDAVKEIMNTLEFIYEEYKPTPMNKFVFNGAEYKTEDDIAEVKFEDWVSVQTILYNYKESPVMGLAKLVASMCKKEGETLDSFVLKDRAEEFKELPFPLVKNLECFFLLSLQAYSAVTLLYSTIPDQEKLVLHKLNELRSIMKQRSQGRGMSLRMKLVTGIYRCYLWYLNKQLEKYFNTQHTNISKRNFIQTSKNLLTKKLSRNK